ncbi:MAG: metallophosphoesterase [Armatimonadota bacterium]
MDPRSTGVTVRWITDKPTIGEVEYGTSRNLGKLARETSPTRLHSVRLTNLPPSSTAFYRIRGLEAPGIVHSFRTAPQPGQPFLFAVCGDTRSRDAEHRKVVSSIRTLSPHLLIHTGDLVADGHSIDQWHRYFQIAGPLIAQAPLASVPGNHEGKSRNWEWLVSPSGQRSYSFRYGDCFFLCLDSDPGAVESAAWLSFVRRELEAGKDAAYRIVVMHRPPFTAVWSRVPAARDLRERLVPLLHQYRVDLVLCGHDHNYQHHVVDGVHYVVTGGGGAPLHSITPLGVARLRHTVRQESVKTGAPREITTIRTAKSLHHVVVSVSAAAMRVRAPNTKGEEIDSFDIPRRQLHNTAGMRKAVSGREGTARLHTRSSLQRHSLTAVRH